MQLQYQAHLNNSFASALLFRMTVFHGRSFCMSADRTRGRMALGFQ